MKPIALNTKILASIVAVFAGAAVLLTGCAIGPKFNAEGIPNHRYYVGGGMIIEYKAPHNGTAYVVEETTKKIMVTKSIDEGDPFEFKVEIDDPEAAQQFERTMGKAVNELRFSLFFVPAKEPKTE